MIDYMLSVIIFAFGAILGSFLNVVIYRVPRCRLSEKVLTILEEKKVDPDIIKSLEEFKDSEFKNSDELCEFLEKLGIEDKIKEIIIPAAEKEVNIVLPHSYCPNCKNPIRPHDNIPILGWFFLGGKCRDCKTKISFRYPLNELVTATLLTVVFYFISGDMVRWLFLAVFFTMLIVIFWIDIDHHLILDIMTYPSIIIGLAYSYFITQNITSALIGAVAGPLFLLLPSMLFKFFAKKEGMGMGDVKFAAMLGAWLGWQQLAVALFLSFIVGTVIGLICLSRKGKSEPFPFGPSMVIGAIISFFYGNAIWMWYISGFRM